MTTITINSVIENTKREVANYVTFEELTTIVVGIHDKDGVDGLKHFEDSITIMDETGNVDGLLDTMEELMEVHL